MKTLIKTRRDLKTAGRWDIDFHLPAQGIKEFPTELLKQIDQVATLPKDKRNPTIEPDTAFRYIDISSIDITVGVIANPQDLEGQEAPSRARKVVRAFDLVVSTCRPTRGAIAVVPVKLHNQIASTGFSIVRPNQGVNPFYLHYALRLPSTLEQFRKWSTGSSYPAILDSDVAKTLIPVPDPATQDAIAVRVIAALREREKSICATNRVWTQTLDEITKQLCGHDLEASVTLEAEDEVLDAAVIADILTTLAGLPPLVTDRSGVETDVDNPEETADQALG